MSDLTKDDIDQIKTKVRSSDARVEILRELYPDAERRPKELQNVICPRTGLSKGSVFAGLDTLQELSLVHRLEGDGRAVLYSLTNQGQQIAKELDITEQPEDPANIGPSGGQQDVRDDEMDQADADLAAVGGLDDPDNDAELNFKRVNPSGTTSQPAPTSSDHSDSHHTIPMPTDFEPHPPDPERVDQLTHKLNQYLRQTNVSLPELVAAVNELVEMNESDPGKNTGTHE